ncbi:MAG: hypothetical protein SGILL_006224 [Bacillariaceae sp.]
MSSSNKSNPNSSGGSSHGGASGNSTPPNRSPPTPPRAAPMATDPAVAAAMMAQQQYYGSVDGGVSSHQVDPNVAAAWQQLQFQQQAMQQQQQNLSPVIYHNAPTHGGNGQQQQHPPQNLQYPYMYPYPPPPPYQGGPGGQQPQQPLQQFYPPPSFGYPIQQQQQQQPQSSKPPLKSGKRTPKQSDSKTFDPNNNYNSNSVPTSINTHAASASGNLPEISDIFSGGGSGGGGAPPAAGQSYMSPLADSGGAAVSAYGSLTSAGSGGNSPKVYNAPTGGGRRLPPSGRGGPGLPRTDSGNDLKRRAVASSPKGSHRRTHSDTPLQGANRHRRAGSFDMVSRPGGHSRSRTLSGGNPFMSRPSHRRTNSASSMYSTGDASQVSIRSNIAKSSLFGGVDPHTGEVQMHFPKEQIRVVTIPNESTKKKALRRNKGYGSIPSEEHPDDEYADLTLGHLYADRPVQAAKYYEDYVQISDDLENGATPQWESLEVNPRHPSNGGLCGCQCANCNACIGKQELLPPDNYILPVSDDIYKRVMGEVSDAQSMPCGLFYCGHHEDVSHPNVWIAGVMVILLFGTLLGLAFYTECSDFQCLATE